jgi:hypothetical protein
MLHFMAHARESSSYRMLTPAPQWQAMPDAEGALSRSARRVHMINKDQQW